MTARFKSIDLDTVEAGRLTPATTTIEGECGAVVGNTTCGKRTKYTFWDSHRSEFTWLCAEHRSHAGSTRA